MGSLVLCLAASGVIFVAAKLGKLDTEEIDAADIQVNKEAEETGEGYTNVALFGIDSRSGELEKGTRTDCIIVASLNNKTKEVRMSSVYRDTLLDIKDGHLQKCNAAYSFGGPTQAINMLNKNLDLDIEKFATVDFAAISETIDLLGGLDINVKKEEIQYLNKFVGETARVAKKKAKKVTKPGKQHLNGVQATTYARIRSTAGGDFTRTERQRLVIQKIVEKAQKSDFATINKIIDKLLPTIKTNFSAAEILSYAKDFTKYKIGASSGFPFEKTTDTISGLGSIVIPVKLDNNVKELHKFLYDDENYKTSSEVKTISNAVVARVGQRQAESSSTLNSKTYKSIHRQGLIRITTAVTIIIRTVIVTTETAVQTVIKITTAIRITIREIILEIPEAAQVEIPEATQVEIPEAVQAETLEVIPEMEAVNPEAEAMNPEEAIPEAEAVKMKQNK